MIASEDSESVSSDHTSSSTIATTPTNSAVGGFVHASSEGGSSSSVTAAVTHRLSYPREFKLLVIEQYYANGQNKYRTCKAFRITK
jgi:hypothetical protein